MTDKELLEYAAKAAGYTLKWGEFYIVGDDEVDCTDLSYVVSGQPDEADWHWNPLTDDGDALRLAVKLKINIEHAETLSRAPHGVNCWPVGRGDCSWMELDISDYAAATRRAIVRAAAAIGEGLAPFPSADEIRDNWT